MKLPNLRPATAGIGLSILANGVIVVVAIVAALLSHEIPLVVSSPSRYSVLVVPIALAAVVAATVSFWQYMRNTRVLGLLGMAIAGFVATLFFNPFPEDPIARRETLIHDYLARLDHIAIGILIFSLLAAASSLWMYVRLRGTETCQDNKAPEHQKEFWLLKGLVCDLPIVIGAALLLYVQAHSLDAAHQQYTEILFDLMGDRKTMASPEFFEAEELQRQLGIANFWIGVSLGITSAQLVAQQLGTLMLEIVFWLREKKV